MTRRPALPMRVLYSALAVIVFACSVFPVYWMVNSALLPTSAVQDSTPHFWPDEFTLRNFVSVVTEPSGSIEFLPALGTSLIVTVSTVVFALFFAFFAALALTRFRFRSRRSLIVALLVAQMIPAEAMIVSIFRVLDGWALVNTVAGLTLVYVATVLPFTIWTLRGFVAGVPADLEEAAMIDGCTKSQAFWKVTFPLLAPGLVATGIFAFIQSWNEFTMALLLMKGYNLTLPTWLNAFQSSSVAGSVDWGAVMAGSTMMAIPVIVFFLIVQGRMTGGLVSGAVKG